MSVAETYKRIPPREFELWFAYYALEPFGPLREDLRFGQVCAAAFNTIRKDSPADASMFFPELAGVTRSVGRKKTVEQMYLEARQIIPASRSAAGMTESR